MPTRPPVAKSPYAAFNAAAKKTYSRERKDSVSAWYNLTPWRKFRKVVLACNSQCQRIVNGEQCHAFASVVHHIVSPRVNPSKFLDWTHVVCICPEHHETTEGENLLNPNTYAITQGSMGATSDPNLTIRILRG